MRLRLTITRHAVWAAWPIGLNGVGVAGGEKRFSDDPRKECPNNFPLVKRMAWASGECRVNVDECTLHGADSKYAHMHSRP